jgi:hypothetical protein
VGMGYGVGVFWGPTDGFFLSVCAAAYSYYLLLLQHVTRRRIDLSFPLLAMFRSRQSPQGCALFPARQLCAGFFNIQFNRRGQ